MDRRTLIGTLVCAGLAAFTVPAIMWSQSGPQHHAKILFGGDLSHAESYAEGGALIVAEHGYDYSLQDLTPLIQRADYAIANLETPIVDPTEPWAQDKEYVHWSRPQSLRALAKSGIDAVGLANNHTLDYGKAGLGQTIDAVRQNRLSLFGAGKDEAEAAAPLIVDIPGPSGSVKAAIFGMFEYRRAYDEKYDFYAQSNIAGANMLSVRRFERQVAEIRKKMPNIFVIAYPHWGYNYSWRSKNQRISGKALIDAGADLVIGHHGHSAQQIDRYRGKWIFYGIGNLMFNAPGRFDKFPDVIPYGLAVELTLSAAGKGFIKLYAVESDNRKTNYRPHIANRDQSIAAFGKLLRKSGFSPKNDPVSMGSDTIGPYLRLELER